MRGQWIGRYTGTTEGSIIVNVDELPSQFKGAAYLQEKDKASPSSVAYFTTADKAPRFEFRTTGLSAVNPQSGAFVSWAETKNLFPETVVFSRYADVTGTYTQDSLELSWTTDAGGRGSCLLPRSAADKQSDLVTKTLQWETFKEIMAKVESRQYLFRGQARPWRLRTSFHRAGRFDIARFIDEDIPALHRHLSGKTKHFFRLADADENGSFLNLVQHHGYPTPLLDWTYSPYVAAFFAYRNFTNKEAANSDTNEKVRIFLFDQAAWRADRDQLRKFLAVGPHLSILEFLAVENERMIPQQATATVTNIDDIETYLLSTQAESGKVYLAAVDLPVSSRRLVMRELALMGITPGAMFPGLEGACAELRERNFEI